MNKDHRLGPAPTPESAAAPGPAQRVLSALSRPEDPSSVTELSAAIDAHPNTVRAALAELRTAGLVQRSPAPTGSRGRPSYDYALTAAGRRAQPSGQAFREYRSLTGAFAEYLSNRSEDPGAAARAIGRSWGAALAGEHATGSATSAAGTPATTEGAKAEAGRRLTGLLAELGFGPESDAHGIALRTCPLLELAEEMPEVICQVHQGLIDGALEHYGAPAEQVRLLPFAEIGACRLHLGSLGQEQRSRRRHHSATSARP